MKKFICLFAMLSIGYGLFAFDRSLNGSWGLTEGKEKEEIIRFNTNEIVLIWNKYFALRLFRRREYDLCLFSGYTVLPVIFKKDVVHYVGQ
ncbi:MAG: hypothetical protein FWF68_05630 [Spirochaetes bacterium]|nr:hypothetical protein [Spirochaetota bacterium]